MFWQIVKIVKERVACGTKAEESVYKIMFLEKLI